MAPRYLLHRRNVGEGFYIMRRLRTLGLNPQFFNVQKMMDEWRDTTQTDTNTFLECAERNMFPGTPLTERP